MANTYRHRTGATDTVVNHVLGFTVIEIGDLLFIDPDSKDALPASDLGWSGSLEATQAFFKDNFGGVALQASAAGNTAPIRIATAGIFDFDADQADYTPGQLVAPAKSSGDGLLNQQLAAAAGNAQAVARVHEQGTTGATTVTVRIVSTKFHGGTQPAA